MRYTAPLRSDELRSRLRSQSRAQLRARARSRLTEVDVASCASTCLAGGRLGEVPEWFLGRRGTSVPACRQNVQRCYVLGTPYLMLASRVGNHFRPPVPASLQPAIRRTVQQAKVGKCVCVCAVVKRPVISLPYTTPPSRLQRRHPSQGEHGQTIQPLYFAPR